MGECKKCKDHTHEHGDNCGHVKIKHGDHYDYLHEGELHHLHGDHVDEHVLEISDVNPDKCDEGFQCGDHVHGPGCGHEVIKHGDHIDYIVDGVLHHQHDGHCDNHGPVEVLENNKAS